MAATPLGLGKFIPRVTQGSSCLATLGWRTQSLWDWAKRTVHESAIKMQSVLIPSNSMGIEIYRKQASFLIPSNSTGLEIGISSFSPA